jgi:hypothetical protein
MSQEQKPRHPEFTHNQTRPTMPFFRAVMGILPDDQPATVGGASSGSGGGGAPRMALSNDGPRAGP